MAGGFDALEMYQKHWSIDTRYRNELQTGSEVIPLEVIQRPPSAELAPGQLDRDSLPDYDTLDIFWRCMLSMT